MPCGIDPMLCSGPFCACVDPDQPFSLDLLAQKQAGQMDCEGANCGDVNGRPDYQEVEYTGSLAYSQRNNQSGSGAYSLCTSLASLFISYVLLIH